MTPRLTLHLSLLAWLLMAVASGQQVQWGPCPGGVCPPQYQQPRYAQPQPQGIEWSNNPSDVVVKAHAGNGSDVGSGTVVHTDGQVSYVLTNHHVIRDGRSFEVHVQGTRYAAQLVDTDQQNDLAILRVNAPLVAVQIGEQTPGTVTIRSYDGGRLFRRRTANVKGRTAEGALVCGTIILGGSSGGGCYDGQGRLVGVVWGCVPQDRETYFTPVGPIRTLLTRIGLIGAVQVQPPQQPTQPQQPQYPQATDPGPEREQVQLPPCKCDAEWDAMAAKWQAQVEINRDFDARIAILEATQPVQGERGPVGPQGPPGPAGKDADVGPLTDRIAALEAELAALRDSKFKVITHTPQGVFDSEDIPLGGDIHLQYVEARKGDAPK